MSLYTQEEVNDINEAWFAFERIIETDYEKEFALEEAIKYEAKFRHITNAKALMLREMLNCKSIRKGDLFAYSKGVGVGIMIAWSIFYHPITQDGFRLRYKKFKKLAKQAMKSHDNAIERKFNANSGS